MKRKRVISLIAILLGVCLIGYAVHSWNKIQNAKGIEQDMNNFFTHNPSVWDPLIKFFGGKAQQEVSKYDLPVLIMFISGSVLTMGGIISLGISLKKSKS